jgi:hypothetical protein
VALPFTLKTYLKAKQELWKHSKISPCKNNYLQNNPPKETKILQNMRAL